MKRTNLRTGILTLSSAENYGAVLQSLSLMCFLQENYGHAEIINFTPRFIIGRYPLLYINNSSLYKAFITCVKSIARFPILFLKRIRFVRFRKKNCDFSRKKYKIEINDDDYDLYFVGSDQVFNLSLTWDEKSFFLPFVSDSKKKNTYAASIGLDSVSEKQKKMLFDGLKEFSHISIREKNGAELLKSLFPNKRISSNIDPVFLHNRFFWEKYSSNKTRKEEYVLIYSFAQEDVKKSIDFSKKNFPDYKILLISNSLRKVDSSVTNIRGVGPSQFLELVKDAECVVTNSFHGCAFSIIFEKEFYVIKFKGTSSRMTSLLDLLCLENRLISNEMILNNKKIDYEEVNKKIKKEVECTKKYFFSIYYSKE